MELIKEGELVIKDGKYPSQVVLRLIKPGTYATHIKVRPPGAEPHFILGNYFFKLPEAETDFAKRVIELQGP